MFTQLIQRNPELFMEDLWPGFKTLGQPHASHGWGALDIVEHKDHYSFTADFPGIQEKDIKVEFTDGELTIEAERKSASEEKDEETKVLRRERREQKFRRTFELGDAVDAEKIEGQFRDGVLTLKVPKAERIKPRTIPIRIAS